MKVKKIVRTLLTTTFISQLLLPLMQVRAEETKNSQALEAKANTDTVKSEAQVRVINKTKSFDESDDSKAEQAAKVAVDNLFADESHTVLNDKITQATIDDVQQLVDDLSSGEVKTQLSAEIKKARDLSDKKNNEVTAEQAAKAAVDNLFINSTHTILIVEATQATIDAAQKVVDVLPAGETKTKLSAEIKKAQDLLDKRNEAYWIAKATEILDYILRGGVSPVISEINFTEAEHFIGKIKNNTAKKAALSKTLAEARKQYNYNKELEASVKNLFLTNTTLNPNVTQETINSLKEKVPGVSNTDWRNSIQQSLDKAQRLLSAQTENKAEQAAKVAVNNLFTDVSHTALNDKTTQATIDAAQKVVDALPASEVKTQLTAEIKKAQDLLAVLDDSKIDVVDYVMGTDRYVKGQISGKVIKKVALEINGKLKKSVNVTTGPFQYWTVGQILSDKDEVFVIGLDASGNEVKRNKVNIIPSNSKVNLTVSSFVLGKDNYITGTYQGNVKTVALRIDGVLTQKIAVKDGAIKYYAKGKIKDSSSKVELVAIDATGKEIAKQIVKVSDIIASIKVDLYKLDESYIQGTYTGDAKYMAIEVNGRRLQTIGIAKGVIKYYAKGKIASVNDKVTIILLDGNKTEIQRTPLKMLTTNRTLALNSYKLNAAYLTGTYTGDIVKVRMVINDVAQRIIPVSGNKVQYYARNLIKKVTDTVIVEGLDAGNNVLDSKTVEITK